MTDRHRHRRAAFIALCPLSYERTRIITMDKTGFASLAEMKAATQLVEMRREAQEFEAEMFSHRTTRTPCKWTMPACNGQGHSGALS